MRGEQSERGKEVRGGDRIAASDDEGRKRENIKDSAGVTDRSQQSVGNSDEDLPDISSQIDPGDRGLEDLQTEEISGGRSKDIESANYSDTDEDENEGLGDGKIGRTVRGDLK